MVAISVLRAPLVTIKFRKGLGMSKFDFEEYRLLVLELQKAQASYDYYIGHRNRLKRDLDAVNKTIDTELRSLEAKKERLKAIEDSYRSH